jgi:hypothetical protein
LDIIDTYAAANGLKRSEAIRALIDEGIIATFPHIKIAETPTRPWRYNHVG